MSNFTTGVEWNSSFVVPSNYPLNALDIADNVAEVLAKLPTNRRYVGLSVFLLDENRVYRFTKHDDGAGGLTSGILDSDFQPEQSGGFDITKWQTNKDYAKDTYVVYNYKLYKALEDVVGGVTFDESKFELYIGDSGGGGVFKTTSPITNKIGQFDLNEEYTDADNISLNEAINMILHLNKEPEFNFEVTKLDSLMEIGKIIQNPRIRLVFTNLGNGNITNIQFLKDGAEIYNQAFVDGTNEYTYDDISAINSDVTYKVVITYNFGKGDKTLEKELSFKFVRQAFYGTSMDDTFDETSDNIRTLSGKLLGVEKGSKFKINIAENSKMVIFAYPSSIGDVDSVKYIEAFNTEVSDVFEKKTLLVSGYNNNSPIVYNLYIYKPDLQFIQTVNYEVTI